MPLTDTHIRNAKPASKQYRLADAGGLSLVIKPTGAKLWHYRFRLDGKEQTYAIGSYPAVTLSGAREALAAAKAILKAGGNPVRARQTERLVSRDQAADTFEALAMEWVGKKAIRWAPTTYNQCLKVMQTDVFPKIGKLPIREVTAAHILAIMKAAESRGAEIIAILIRQWCSQIFRYAVVNLRADVDPAAAIAGVIHPPPVTHRKPLSQDKIKQLFDALNSYGGHAETVIAIKLLAHTFVRTVELRMAKWEEIDLVNERWTIPAERMKKRRPHVVPLSSQVIALLNDLHRLTGNSRSGYLFPSTRSRSTSCMSSTTVNRVMEYLGFAGKDVDNNVSGHSFRTTASTMLNELGYRSDVIEMQLAHVEGNRVRGSYNMAQYMPERIAMMQSWSDLLDQYAIGDNKVVPIKRA